MDSITDDDLEYLNGNLSHVKTYLEHISPPITGARSDVWVLERIRRLYHYQRAYIVVDISTNAGLVMWTPRWKPLLAYVNERADTTSYVFK